MNELGLFNSYYRTFDNEIADIRRKYEHTFRVVMYACEIAESLDLPKEDVELAMKCALFHDIARFKQWSEYQTYEDAKSFDHGDMGYSILKELGINDEIILISTKYHNKYDIPNDLDERTMMFCNITRDADKLDIMNTQALECNDVNYYINDDILTSFREHKLLSNKLMDEKTDVFLILLCLAFIFDMNFKGSLEIVKNKNLVNIKCDQILKRFNKDEIKEIKDICNKYIDERLK